jgi:hypothetical protein
MDLLSFTGGILDDSRFFELIEECDDLNSDENPWETLYIRCSGVYNKPLTFINPDNILLYVRLKNIAVDNLLLYVMYLDAEIYNPIIRKSISPYLIFLICNILNNPIYRKYLTYIMSYEHNYKPFDNLMYIVRYGIQYKISINTKFPCYVVYINSNEYIRYRGYK